jgi:AcrR family transcriptional regulator
MVSVVSLDSHVQTREALLEAAAEVFAELGFRAATVREICQRARANIAAVNYHFGDKENLYLEVLRFTQRKAYEKFPTDLGVGPNATAQEKLRAFIRSFLLRIFADGEITHHGKIMSREMIEPTGALEKLIEEKIRPQSIQLSEIVGELLGGNATDENVRLCACSIVSQCCFYHHCRPVLSRLFPDQEFSQEQIENIAEHIYQFSLAAMRQLARQE